MEDKIEVGVITCGNRPIHEYGCDVGIFTDTEKRGAAYAKNRLIKKFYDECKGHIFIFDDDAYPVIDGWKEKIIDWCEKNGVHYLGGIDLKNAKILSAEKDVLQISSPYIGAFYYLRIVYFTFFGAVTDGADSRMDAVQWLVFVAAVLVVAGGAAVSLFGIDGSAAIAANRSVPGSN